jgi:hypothetical protein
MVQKLRSCFPFLFALAAGLCFITLQVTGLPFTHYPGDLIDGRFNNYLLEHAYRYMTGAVPDFWNAPFMYPEKQVISYSDNLVGTAPVYAFFRLLGSDREQAFQFWYVVIAALNFTACYGFLKYVFKNNYASAAGALVFAFSLALHSQMGHAQTFPRFPVPLAFLGGMLFIRELKPAYFLMSLFFVAYQIYCGIYLGLILLAAMLLFYLISFFVRGRLYLEKIRSPKWCLQMLGVLLLTGLLVWPLMGPYLDRASELGFYTYEQTSKSLLTLKSFFFSWGGSLFWGPLNGLCVQDFVNFCDYQVFPGAFATLGLLIFLTVTAGKLLFKSTFPGATPEPALKQLFFTGILLFIVFMRFGEYSLYRLFYNIPGFGSMRALQRIINVELLFYAVGCTFVLSLLLRKDRKFSPLFFILVVTLMIMDNYVRPDAIHRKTVAESKGRVEPLMKKMQSAPPQKILSYEPDSVDSSINDFQLDAMLAAQSLGVRTLNGYSSTSPPVYSNYWSYPSEASRMDWINARQVSPDSVFVVK